MLFETITDKLMDAGFTPTTARTQAELLAQRYATRSARLGRELTGDEFSDVLVHTVLPERLAAAQQADQLDMTINVMRRGVEGRERVVWGKTVSVRVDPGGRRNIKKKTN